MSGHTDVLGIVLAGGSSVRMGRDKSLLPLEGMPLIAHSTRLMQSFFREVIIVSDLPQKYEFLNLEIIPDMFKGAGPLGGMHAALSHARTETVFISSCDIPLVPSQLLEYILDFDSPRHTRIPRHLGILQPLFGLYDRDLIPIFEKHLLNSNFRVLSALEETAYVPVEISPGLSFYSSDMFSNVNDPEDYAHVKSHFKESTQPSF